VQRSSGMAVDGWVLGLGFLAVGGVVLVLAAVSAWRVGAVRHRSPTPRVAVADRFASAGAGVVPTLGMRMAFDRSRAARAGQLSIAACTMAVASVVAAGVVLSSYDALLQEPERFGQRWDVSFGDFSTRASMEEAVAFLEARGDVASAVGELSDAGTARDLPVTVVAYLPGIGRMEPTVASGRVPIGPDEVLLGETAARALGVEIGDEIPLTIDFLGSTRSVTVVGFGVAGTALADPHPGRVAYVTPEAFEGAVELAPQILLVELEPGADVEAATAALEDAYPDTVVGATSIPRSVLLWDQLSYAPVALAVAVLVLAAVALVNALVSSVRRRGRELAVLKALGAGRRQIRGVVAWQATAWALVAALIGLPLGVVISASGWEAITTSLGLRSPTAVPVLFVAAVALSIVAIANVVALLPGRAAAKVTAASALRTE
jgi:putative ABC transport system permease protein